MVLTKLYNASSWLTALIIMIVYRIYRRYSMETIIATAFGRVINVQRNESDELAEAGISLFGSFKTKQEQNIKTQYLSMMLLCKL